MAGLQNQWRDYVVDGEPAAIGLGPGRRCCALHEPAVRTRLQHRLLERPPDGDGDRSTPTIVRGPRSPTTTALRSEIHPWYRSSVEQDREARRVAAAMLAGEDPYGDASDPRAFTRSVLRDGLAPALRSDQVVLRAFVRNLNLLSPPDALADRCRLRRPGVRRAADQGRTSARTVPRSDHQSRLRRRHSPPPDPSVVPRTRSPAQVSGNKRGSRRPGRGGRARGTSIRSGGCRG